MKSFTFTILSLLSILLIFNSCKKESSPEPVELIKVGDMESYPWQDWKFGFYYNLISNPNSYNAEYSLESATSGTHSLKLTCSTIKNDTTFCFFTQNVQTQNISKGAKLTLKAKIKTVDIKGQGITLLFIGYKAANFQNKTVFDPKLSTPITGTTEFKEYTVVLDSYPGDTDIIAVYMFYLPKTTGTVYLDDVSLTAQ